MKATVRYEISNPFELSEYAGDINDGSVEFWCKKCQVPAAVHIDPRDNQVEMICCPIEGADHFCVCYEPLHEPAFDDVDDDGLLEELLGPMEGGDGEEDVDFDLCAELANHPLLWLDTSQFMGPDFRAYGWALIRTRLGEKGPSLKKN